MSSISVNTITDAAGGTTTTVNGFTPTVSNMAGRNKIINGDMRIAQRGGTATGVSSQTYVLDRWNAAANGGPTCTVEQSTTAPAGFVNSLKYTVTTGATIDATDYSDVRQYIEGLNLSDLGWGTANAKPVTLSFWVRCSQTGTFAVSFVNSGYDSYYPASYTINSADTWEYKTVTIAGPTSGTWLTTNGVGMRVVWDLGVGSDYSRTMNTWGSTYVGFGGTGAVKIASTTGATFYITGVQLEAGSVATPFEHIDYGEMLRRCQRYFYMMANGSDISLGIVAFNGTTDLRGCIWFPVTMRATPSLSVASGTGYYRVYNGTINNSFTAFTSDLPSNLSYGIGGATGLTGASAGSAAALLTNSASAKVSFSSEL